jgi:hypothetical protein
MSINGVRLTKSFIDSISFIQSETWKKDLRFRCVYGTATQEPRQKSEVPVKKNFVSRSSLLIWCCWFSFGSQAIDSQAQISFPECSKESKKGALCIASISQLRPTQIAVGGLEVQKKERKIKKLINHPEILAEIEFEEPEPTVIGPDGNLFIVDHHHLALALYRQGVYKTFCVVLENLSNFSETQFWDQMIQNHWIYPYDENGIGPYAVQKIPSSLLDLKNDPYRSLAGAVKAKGGYQRTSIPFADFQWANFFRSRIIMEYAPGGDPDKSSFKKATEAALRLAGSPDAAQLPGFKGGTEPFHPEYSYQVQFRSHSY